MTRSAAFLASAAVAVSLVPGAVQAQTQTLPPSDSGWVKLSYTITTSDGAELAAVHDSIRMGRWPWEASKEAVKPKGQDGMPIRTPVRKLWEENGCKLSKRRPRFQFSYRKPPAVGTRQGTPPEWLSLSVGGHPANREQQYTGPGTYEIEWPAAAGSRSPRRAWDFKHGYSEMAWREGTSASSTSGRATVFINPDQRSGSFTIGPFRDRANREITLHGKFACDLLQWL